MNNNKNKKIKKCASLSPFERMDKSCLHKLSNGFLSGETQTELKDLLNLSHTSTTMRQKFFCFDLSLWTPALLSDTCFRRATKLLGCLRTQFWRISALFGVENVSEMDMSEVRKVYQQLQPFHDITHIHTLDSQMAYYFRPEQFFPSLRCLRIEQCQVRFNFEILNPETIEVLKLNFKNIATRRIKNPKHLKRCTKLVCLSLAGSFAVWDIIQTLPPFVERLSLKPKHINRQAFTLSDFVNPESLTRLVWHVPTPDYLAFRFGHLPVLAQLCCEYYEVMIPAEKNVLNLSSFPNLKSLDLRGRVPDVVVTTTAFWPRHLTVRVATNSEMERVFASALTAPGTFEKIKLCIVTAKAFAAFVKLSHAGALPNCNLTVGVHRKVFMQCCVELKTTSPVLRQTLLQQHKNQSTIFKLVQIK